MFASNLNAQDLLEIQHDVKRANCDSMLKLALVLLSETDLIAPNTQQAHELLSKAALLNNLEAKMLLASLYENGHVGHDGVEIAKDKEFAYHLYSQLSQHEGYELAIEKIGDSYLETDSNAALWVSAEYAEKMAYHYYEQAALKGLASAEFKQAMMHKEGKGTPKNIGMAQYMLYKSASQGYAPALKEYDQNRELYV